MLTFDGRFTLRDVEEIKETLKSENGPIFIVNIPKTFEEKDSALEESELTLSSGKTVYVYKGDFSSEEHITYRRFTAKQLKTLFTSYMQKQYNYVPAFAVQLDAFIWLPVEVKFWEYEDEEVREKDENFQEFWQKFQYDMARVPNKHTGDDFEFGDKLLQLIFGKETASYEIVGADSGDDVVFTEEDEEDEGAVIVAINEGKELTLLTKVGAEKELSRARPDEVLQAIVYGDDMEHLRSLVSRYDLTEPVVAGMCAIHVAADAGKLDALKVIVESGSDVNLPDLGYGYTALGYAAGKNDLSIVLFLLENGANPHRINHQGGTAMNEAKIEGMRLLIQQYLQ